MKTFILPVHTVYTGISYENSRQSAMLLYKDIYYQLDFLYV